MNNIEQYQLADKNDDLACFKSHFNLPNNILYLDGNSLGAMPKQALERAQQVVNQEWQQDLIQSWNKAGWFEMPVRLGSKLGQLIGAKEGETVVTDTTSINVFKALAAALHIQKQKYPQKRIILSEKDTFPTDLYMIQGLINFLQQDYELRLIDEDLTLDQALNDEVAVVLLSQVNYRTGYLHDMPATTLKTHNAGALIIWDLCHSAGALPIDLHASNADFAVGCTYKYLNAGPGAPAFIWVHPQYVDDFIQPLSGWWGHKQPFAMHPLYTPNIGISRYLCGTQPILSLALVECGLDVALEAGMQAIRQKSLALTDLFIKLVEENCAEYGLSLVTPRDHKFRGSQVSFVHKEGYAIIQALIARGVVGDYREPSILRFGFTPLYFGYEDTLKAVTILQEVLQTKAWDVKEFKQRLAVT